MTDDELAQKRHLADAALHRAIELHAEAYHLDDDGDLLSSYAIVSCWLTDDHETSTYLYQFSSPSLPAHEALGLFTMGVNHVVTDL